VAILLSAGILFTVRTRLIQIRRLPEAFRLMLASQQSAGGGALSPFQAFMTALAATIGVGNIAGVAAAIISGGPGALFWIWAYGFIAAAIKFAEASLGVRFRIPHGEQTLAGPMYYLRDGLGSPALAWLYALIAGIACLFTTPFTQPNSIAVILDTQLKDHHLDLGRWAPGVGLFPEAGLELNRLAIGVILAILTWLVIIGGVKSIGRAAEVLSPLKVGFYMIGGLIVIGINISKLPEVLRLVFHEAFSINALEGATLGAFMKTAMAKSLRYGFARGGYATEAGFGTAAVVYGVARSDHPEQQGLNAMMEVFIITFVTCTISALTILLSGSYATEGIEGPAALNVAFNSAMPGVGGWMLAFSVFLFGYTTLMGWSFYGEQFLEYLFGRWIIMPYRWAYCALIPLGAIAKVNLVWAWGDMLNGSQIFPNLIGLLALSGLAAKFARTKSTSSVEVQ
jgi:AGCS family alanine or glycine:cation symporter